ncbi:uncharacterized protein LOC108886528 isoform X3 [Lates calcarifer]|uniref:Uncharacterized protein LOC108886528 isoform X3 n=1 Tax=Lates calcarifer TaxID=8187 RepID=A0AAJ8BDK8_LATCA|nr:uncharacterized protein LOC108886528 isoform X3 [Lates calcarifer]
MAGRLLFVILMCSFHEIQVQALPPPKLTVNPPAITETDSVTLNCQTPSSVSVSQCYFYTVREETKVFSCLKTLTGTELLLMAHQSSPAVVELKCFYGVKSGGSVSPSPHSDTSSITVNNFTPPKLTVNPPVITETDSVTLNCQTPSSVSVSHCYFYTVSGGTVRVFSCLKTLTGTELLNMAHQSSPAVVKVKCYYDVMYPSPESDLSTIVITLPPAKLTVNPPVITETDSVTLNCQTPSSVYVSQCYFYTVREETKVFPCLKTLTGTELLLMAHQSSPAVVELKCFYSVKSGALDSPSPHSDTSSITVNSVIDRENKMKRDDDSTTSFPSQKPQMSVQHFIGDYVHFSCSLPGSADSETRCNLYFGETSRPVQTTTIRKTKSSTKKKWFCQFYVTIDDFLRHLCFVQQKEASCDYSLGSEHNSLSPRSDGRNLTDIVEKESPPIACTTSSSTVTTGVTVNRPHSSTPVTPVKTPSAAGATHDTGGNAPTFLTSVDPVTGSLTSADTTCMNPTSGDETTGLTVGAPRKDEEHFISISQTPEKPASEMGIWMFVIVGVGVAVGVISLGLALLCIRRRSARRSDKRAQASDTGDSMCKRNLDCGGPVPAGDDETYSVITSVPGATVYTDGLLADSEKLNRREPQNDYSDIYHLYCTISEEPTALALRDMVYSSVQPH